MCLVDVLTFPYATSHPPETQQSTPKTCMRVPEPAKSLGAYLAFQSMSDVTPPPPSSSWHTWGWSRPQNYAMARLCKGLKVCGPMEALLSLDNLGHLGWANVHDYAVPQSRELKEVMTQQTTHHPKHALPQ